jgi:uncharacterized RDD family membrane protein YckC
MALAAVGQARSERAEYARDARIMRGLALVVDMIVFGVISFVVNSVYGVTVVTSGSTAGGFYSSQTVVGGLWLTALSLLYFIVPEALFGATPGKLWARLRVVRVDGRPLGVREVIARNVLRLVDFLPALYLLGGASVLVTTNSQRLGDLAAGTTVVYRHRAMEPGATRRAGPAAARAVAAILAAAVFFTIVFDYFGRPPLVVEGEFNQHRTIGADVTSYSLGSPTWGFGEVSYPIKLSTRAGGVCTGTMVLRWRSISWNVSESSYTCLS